VVGPARRPHGHRDRGLRDPAGGIEPGRTLAESVREHVAKQIGAIAKPADVRFTDALPKTRSGKIMRRLLRDIAAGKAEVGDTTTLEDYSVLARLRESEEGRSGPLERAPSPAVLT
jgi:hypothetical protein